MRTFLLENRLEKWPPKRQICLDYGKNRKVGLHANFSTLSPLLKNSQSENRYRTFKTISVLSLRWEKLVKSNIFDAFHSQIFCPVHILPFESYATISNILGQSVSYQTQKNEPVKFSMFLIASCKNILYLSSQCDSNVIIFFQTKCLVSFHSAAYLLPMSESQYFCKTVQKDDRRVMFFINIYI